MRPAAPLRFRPLWLALGWAMVGTVVYLSLAHLQVDLSEGRDKWSHLAAYGALMYWFCLLYSGQGRLAAGFVALGIGLEIAQGFTGYRSFDPADMLANSAGVVLGWLLARTRLRQLLQWLEKLSARIAAG